jgi:hypothetical protein
MVFPLIVLDGIFFTECFSTKALSRIILLIGSRGKAYFQMRAWPVGRLGGERF